MVIANSTFLRVCSSKHLYLLMHRFERKHVFVEIASSEFLGLEEKCGSFMCISLAEIQ